jgi:glutamate racemase
MIGVFDSGHGGLTVLRTLAARLPDVDFVYLGDHALAPYGNRPASEVLDLTCDGVEVLFRAGAKLVLLACNTATCIAARSIQQEWLPQSDWQGRNVLGIVAPTVEAATQVPWAVTTPQYPQKNNTDLIVVFGTTRTITSHVYPEEIRKRCPRVTVIQQVAPMLAGAIEAGADEANLDRIVATAVRDAMEQAGGRMPDRAILGCTHYPIVEAHFRRHLPPGTRVLSQPECVADSLDDYLGRRSHYVMRRPDRTIRLFTTGQPDAVSATAHRIWAEAPHFVRAPARA